MYNNLACSLQWAKLSDWRPTWSKAQMLSIMVHHDAQRCMLHDENKTLIRELFFLFALLCKGTLWARHTLTRTTCIQLCQNS